MEELPVEVINGAASGRVVLLCEHASNHIPDKYRGLGLSPEDRESHAAWDPGARELTCLLSQELDAVAVMSRVSRLVYDCNRPPEAPSAIPKKSELIEVPGNICLSDELRAARVNEVYAPFCGEVDKVLNARGSDTVIVTIHSFTPVFFGKPRAVEIGLLHDDDTRLVDAMLEQANLVPDRRIERNEPYGPQDGVTHSLKLHALTRGMANVMIEVRNDLMRNREGVVKVAEEVLSLLLPAMKKIVHMEKKHEQNDNI